MKKAGCFLIVCLIVLFISCSNDDDDNNDVKLSFIDITNAKALVVIPNKSLTPKAVTGNDTFAKLLEDGSIVQVIIKDKNNSTVNKIPSSIIDTDYGYSIIIVDNIPYLVNKINGNAYDLSPVGIPSVFNGTFGTKRKSVFSDNNGYLYYVSDGRIRKININDPNNITAEAYSPDIYNINPSSEFCVDKNGIVIFTDGWGTAPLKIKKPNNAIINTGTVYTGKITFRGFDDEIVITPLTIEMAVATELGIRQVSSDIQQNGAEFGWLYFPNIVIFVQLGSGSTSYKYYNNSITTFTHDAYLFGGGVKYLRSSNDHYYFGQQNGQIVKVDPTDNSSETYLTSLEYDLFNMTVTNDNVVLFNALRYSDSKKVLGTISSDGNVTIIDDNVPNEIIILEKVN